MLIVSGGTPANGALPRAHWVDRLARRVAGDEGADSQPDRGATTLAPGISRRRALGGTAAFLAGLAVDAGWIRAPGASANVGANCADQAYKDCLENAESNWKDDLKPRVKNSDLDKALAGVTADLNWLAFRNYCAHTAAQRHCGPCETCGYDTGTCVSICESDQLCQNGTCACAPCYQPAANMLGIGCDPVDCPPGQACNPNTGQCETTCGGQTCSGGPDCCFGGECGQLCPSGELCCPPGFKCCLDVPPNGYICCSGNCCPPYHTCNVHC